MKIPSGNEIANYVNRSGLSETQKTDDKAVQERKLPEESREGDIVDLSQRSKDVQRVQQVLQNEPDVRMEKIKAIREKIENGEYEVDYDGTAEKMLDAFFDDLDS